MMIKKFLKTLVFIAASFFLLIPLMGKTQKPGKTQTALFGGGCFWCMQPSFDKLDGLDGIIETTVGFAGGTEKNPSYEDVSAGKTKHLETIQITYDPEKVSYEKLLDVFWRQIDPADNDGQFVDRGPMYHSVIFYDTEEQKRAAELSKDKLASSGRFDKPLVTEIRPVTVFYPAEDYHQKYYQKNPLRYKYYRWNSGRDQFLEKVWSKDISMESKKHARPSEEELLKKLTPLQYQVTQKEGTELPFKNEYWDNKKEGLYVDAVSGEPLFSSKDKFDSGTGWPSFAKPIGPDAVITRKDRKLLFMVRTEVKSKLAGSHLGHVFDDGPAPAGLRYCINSAALRFIPVEELEKEGYGEFLGLFK